MTSSVSSEIVGDVAGALGAVEEPEAIGFERCNSFVLLDEAAYDQGAGADDEGALGGEQGSGYDGVGEAGFVLDGDEDETLGGGWLLADYHQAGDHSVSAAGCLLQLGRREHATRLQALAHERHGMRAGS